MQAGNKVTIVDTVSYFNLEVGKTYIMKGTLMNKEAGKALTVDGKKVTAEKTFTPKTKDGTVKLTFTFNAAAIKDGSKLVVFEKCYEYDTKTKTEDKLIAKHTDLNDDGQTVTLIRKDGRIEFETDRGDDDDSTIGIVPKTSGLRSRPRSSLRRRKRNENGKAGSLAL